MPEELPLTLFVIQVFCQRQENRSNPYYSFVFRGKIRDFSPTLQSSSLALIWLYPSPQCEDLLGPRGGTHSEPMFPLHLDHIPDTQDPGIFLFEHHKLTFSPDLYSWIILLMDTRVSICCGSMDKTQICMLGYLTVCSSGSL